jgi:hypothetical protein
LNLIRVMPAKGRSTMPHSKQIAGLVGPTLAAIGIAMLVNRNVLLALGAFLSYEGYRPDT